MREKEKTFFFLEEVIANVQVTINILLLLPLLHIFSVLMSRKLWKRKEKKIIENKLAFLLFLFMLSFVSRFSLCPLDLIGTVERVVLVVVFC